MKIKQSETVTLKRSEISFAPYNPRKRNEKVVADLKRNFKKVGYLGGIVVNKNGTLVSGHKRVEAMDLIFKYDGKNDYDIKIELADLDEKTEKEQNIYMNNKAVQGEFDYQILAGISKDIDFENTGLTDLDLNKIAVFAPDIQIELPPPEKKELTPEQKEKNIENLKELKKTIKEDFYDDHDDASNAHLTLVFDNYDNKVAFMEMMELDSDQKMIKGEDFAERLNMFE